MINKDSIIIGITETKTSFIGDEAYKYMYRSDNIGNRVSANENGVNKSYTVNDLNQYTANSIDTGFTPTYDADGNQTRIKTSAGIFTVEYNAENRPIQFKGSMGRTYNMSYDYMGRRFYMSSYFQGMHDGDSTELFYYNGYTLIESQKILLGPNAMRFTQSYIWDPTSGQATRPLAMFNSNSKTLSDARLSDVNFRDVRFDVMFDNTQNIHYYTHDANKNVTELISDSGAISAHYEYSPFGAMIASSGDLSYSNPFQFSSEFSDHPLGLIYYNYRHYNPLDGRWINRDPIEEQGGFNLYGAVKNNLINKIDYRGLTTTITTTDNNGNNGTVTLPSGFTLDELTATLEKIKSDGKKICTLKIYGHALSQFVFMNDITQTRWGKFGRDADSGTVGMTVFNGVVTVSYYGENGEDVVQQVDLTKLLGDVLGENATINLCGCNTASFYDPDNIAKKLSEVFKNALVRGSSGFMFGDPTGLTEFAYRFVYEYINGKRVDWRGRLMNYLSDLCCNTECSK